MATLFTHSTARGQIAFQRYEGSLIITAGGCQIAQLAGLPDHVAEHTAAAFNRAMQAVPVDGLREGWTYTTKSGLWHITCPMPRVYQAQHDEVTGDGDPSWMFADADTLIGCMDEIDRIEGDEMEDAA